MNGWRRFLSLMLTAALLLGLVPGTALAEGCHEYHDEDCGYQEASPGTPCDHVCDESCAAGCAHICDGSCAYEAATEGAPCAHSCEVCAVTTVSSWTWVDPDGDLEDGELALPGVSEDVPVDFAAVVELLPAAVSTEYGDLAVEFTCPDFPEAATGGEYTFTATLPAGFILSGDAAPLTVRVILGGGELLAENDFTSGYWKYSMYVGTNKVSITAYTGSATTVVVPATLAGYPVGDIGTYCFSDTKVKNVTISSGVGKISSYAFRNADSLQSVTIQGGPTIDIGAFYSCDALTTVDLGSTTQIGQDAFCGCSSLKSITIPSTVRSIGRFAFSASGLTSVSIGSGVTTIGEYAFSNTYLTSITLPATATLADGTVFNCCRDLASINVSSSSRIYKSVDGVLYSYNGRTLVAYPRARAGEVYQILPGTTTIGEYAFNGYNSSTTTLSPGTMKYLKRIWFPPSITTLSDRAIQTTSSLIYCFCGDAPSYDIAPLGSGTVWYTEGRSGWSDTFAYRTATPWPPEEHCTKVLETYPATCGKPGTVKKECTLCGFVATVEDPDAPATGDHTWKGVRYSQVYLYIEPFCTVCDFSYRVTLAPPADCTYTGEPIEAVVTGSIPESAGTWTLTYTGEGLVDGKPVGPGSYRAVLLWTTEGNSGRIYINYSIVPAAEEAPEAMVDYTMEVLWGLVPGATYLIGGEGYTADESGYIPLEESWTGTTVTIIKKSTDPNILDSEPQTLVIPDRPAAPEGITAQAETVEGEKDGKLLKVESGMEYRPAGGEWLPISGDTVEGLASGDYEVRYSSSREGLASHAVTVTVGSGKLRATLTHGEIPRQLWTGNALAPQVSLTFTRDGKTLSLTLDGDYTLTYEDNVDVGTATVTVAPKADGAYVFEPVTVPFQIGYGVRVPDAPENGTLWVDGVAQTLDGDILWLEEPRNALITNYAFHNAGAEDIHTVYPTGMTVWELRGTEIRRLEAMDDALLYAGTSIRTTGNQGIRFITSVPRGLKNALKGGLEGYTLVEYGTLMGWYAPGTDLLWGVNAKSVAYSKESGADAVFAQTNTAVQFTGMLTDLDLEQSTRDLMTRPYMVLEKDGEQTVLYGGQLVRSIGYVALQNKDVFRKGTSDYEFIWKIIAYAYPEIYGAEYGK